jgi:hypothetical protein
MEEVAFEPFLQGAFDRSERKGRAPIKEESTRWTNETRKGLDR